MDKCQYDTDIKLAAFLSEFYLIDAFSFCWLIVAVYYGVNGFWCP